MVKGIDISSNNSHPIDFHKVYAAGYRFVFVKITQGSPIPGVTKGYVNPYAKDDVHKAKEAGLLVGAYAFVDPRSGRTGKEEADFFYKQAREAGAIGVGTLRPAADVEITELPKGRASRKYHYAFIERLEHNLRADGFVAGRSGILKRGTKGTSKPFIYTASWFWDGILFAANGHNCPLWLASYTSKWKSLIPRAFKKGVSIHQYTDQGSVPGIAGHTDLNHYLGKNVRTLKNRHVLRKA